MSDDVGLGRFGDFGGQYAPETLMPALLALEAAFYDAWDDPKFRDRLSSILTSYVGRPTPLHPASRLSELLGVNVLLKREDLAHTGAHKINNALGQGLLAQRMGKTRLISETGAGQHGVASATAAAYLGLECQVFMGAKDIERQALNVYRMELLGTEVIPVTTGASTLKDAVSAAFREWVSRPEDTHYVIGSVVGPHPFPYMVREFQKVIGEEALSQLEGDLPDIIAACVGGGSNAIGIFHPFFDTDVELVGVEAAGLGTDTDKHGASIGMGTHGVLHGSMTYMLQDKDGQVLEAHSISAGLDYPGVGPEHAWYADIGRATYESVTDAEALEAVKLLSEVEGIIPALESAHVIAWVSKHRDRLNGKTVLVNLSGRGDKDVAQIKDMGL